MSSKGKEDSGQPEDASIEAMRAEVKAVFLAARELPPAKRPAYLDERCRDVFLRREVESLLGHDHLSERFLSRSPLDIGRPSDDGETSIPFRSIQADSYRPSLLASGETLGSYRIDDFLARGGHGEVYVGHQVPLNRRVALKVIPVSTTADVDRLLRGARATADVHHPGLVEIYDCGEDADRGIVYCAMRLVDGPTLQEVLEKLASSPCDQRTLARRFLDVANALAALHARGLVHRDVKPLNIVLEGSDRSLDLEKAAVVVDFGLVRTTDSPHSTLRASPFYAAPELLLGQQVDARADVYSLGVCMMDLLSGRSPDRRRRLPSGQFVGLRQTIPGFDRDLDAIVMKATDRVPHWRYGNAGELASDLKAWLEGRAVSARGLHGLESVGRWIRSHPQRVISWTIRGSIAVLLACIVGVGLLKIGRLVTIVERTKEYWREAQLDPLQREVANLPDFLDRFSLPKPLLRHTADLRAMRVDSPVVQVIRALREQGRRSAEQLAARFLERDGLSKHPLLARFLLRSLDPDVLRDPIQSEASLRLIARLFDDRPDDDSAAVRASGAFRSRLMEILLQPDSDPVVRLFAITALGGCGDVDTVHSLVACLAHRKGEGPYGDEEARLVYEALNSITRRSHGCGFLPRLADKVIEAALQTIASERPDLSEALLRSVAFARRASGLRPLSILPEHSSKTQFASCRSARRDPMLLEKLRSNPASFKTSNANSMVWTRRLGQWIGAYENEQAELELERWIEESSSAQDALVSLYREGIRQAHLEREGEFDPLRPDEDTHLGATLGSPPVPKVPVPLEAKARATSLFGSHGSENWRGGVHVDFEAETLTAQGLQVDIELRNAQMRADLFAPGSRYARLSKAGNSEIHLSLKPEARHATDHLRIRITFQKSMRPRVPFTGIAYLDVLWQGRLVGGDLQISSNSVDEFELTLPRLSGSLTRTQNLVLRLGSQSTTILNVLAISAVYVIPGKG